jgi:hypothetical protein
MDNKPPVNGPEETSSGAADERGVQRSVEEQDRQVLAELRRRSRRGFLAGGAAAIAGFGFWRWLQDQPQLNGINAPFRKALEFNGELTRKFFRAGALAPEFDRSKAVADFRLNGDIGLSDIDAEDWRLQLIGVSNPRSYPQYSADVTSWTYGMEEDDSYAHPALKSEGQKPATHEEDAKGSAVKMKPMEMPTDMPKGTPGVLLTMAEIRRLPKIEMVTEFKCIEGWSEIVHWSGARLSDFLVAYPPPTRSDNSFNPQERPDDIPQYVGFETPDGEYYVGIEREVALHPQTLLAYEINNRPLTPDHGAPLRLVTPLKYGIKQLKQIGRITYSDSRPRDYWYEQGYDYYAGH